MATSSKLPVFSRNDMYVLLVCKALANQLVYGSYGSGLEKKWQIYA